MPPTTQPKITGSTRLDSLDAIRAWSMLLGVVFHAAASYMHAPMRGLIMPVQEPPSTRLVDVVFWVLHIFRVPVFFVVAGVVAAKALRRKSTREFLRERGTRLGLVLLVAYPVITLVMQPIWLWGWVNRGWASWGHLYSLQYGPELERAVWGWNHLWFLVYLLIYAVVLAGVFAAFPSLRDEQAGPAPTRRGKWNSNISLAWVLTRLLPAFVLVIGFHVAIVHDPSWFLDFRNAFLPEWRSLVYFGLFFGFGALALGRVESFRSASRLGGTIQPLLACVLASIAAWVAVREILLHVAITDHGLRQGMVVDDTGARLRIGIGVAAAAWLGGAGFLGLAGRFVTGLGPLGRFLVDSAYWVYLTHLPWVGLFVMLLHTLEWPAEAKWVLVAALSIAATLCTFIPVRRTMLGRVLGAHSEPRKGVA